MHLSLVTALTLLSACPASLLQAQAGSAVSPAVPADTEGLVSLLVIPECPDVPDPFVRGPSG